MRFAFIPLTLLMLLMGSSCGGGSALLDSANAGRTLNVATDLPDFAAEALPGLQDGESGLDLHFSLPPAAHVFVEADKGYTATFTLTARVLDASGKVFVTEQVWPDTLRRGDYAATQVATPHVHRRRLALEPGTYVVAMTLTDETSGQQAVRRQRLTVPAAETQGLGRLVLRAGYDGAAHTPVVALRLRGGFTELTGYLAAFAYPEEQIATVHLLRFERDTTVADPPYGFGGTSGRLAYHGIRFDRPDTVYTSELTLAPGSSGAMLALPTVAAGVYRLVAQTPTMGTPQVRDFTVLGPTFPRVETIDDMAAALTYLTRRSEAEAFAAADSPQETKRHFDAFWGERIKERTLGASAIELYYSRVEEANRRFSAFKPGWKTDRGMVFIVMGPPAYIERRLDQETWHYSYNSVDPTLTYTFEVFDILGSGRAFRNHVLQRSPAYRERWQRQITRWRKGQVL